MDSVRYQTRSIVDVRRYVTPDEAAMERAYNLTAIPCGTCVREHSSEHLRSRVRDPTLGLISGSTMVGRFTEPERGGPGPRDAAPMPVNGLRATEPNFF